jgi:hypothetical protein
MSEGYLIPLLNDDTVTQVELLACSIKAIDKTRRVVAVANKEFKGLRGVDSIIVPEGICDDNTFNYFYSLLKSPFDKTIAFLPDQILTKFNVDVWESLRGLAGVVVPKNKHNFAGETSPGNAYWTGSMELKSFGIATNLNAVYFNKDKDACDILGFALKICGSYNQKEATAWALEKQRESQELYLPYFPEFLWIEWVMSFIRKTSQDKIMEFDFVNSIDLSIQEMNHWSPHWSKEPWSRFLNYWVTDEAEIKIENFIQLGLIRYQHTGWLTDKIKKVFKNNDE